MSELAAVTDADMDRGAAEFREMVFEDFRSFFVQNDSGKLHAVFKVMHMEWLISLKYENKNDRLTFFATARLTQSQIPVVHVSLTVTLFTDADCSVLCDRWSGPPDPIAGHWFRQKFAVGQAIASQSRHKALRSMVKTDVVLGAEFTFYCLKLQFRMPSLIDWQSVVSDMWHSEAGADVVLVADGFRIRAHRFVLMARSQYFSGYLTHEPQQRITLNASADAGMQMVRFMYKNEVIGMEELALDLLLLADYYLIDDLIDYCVWFLKHSVTPKNVIRVMQVAKSVGQDELLQHVQQLLNQHVEHPEWQWIYDKLPVTQLIVAASNGECEDVMRALRTSLPKAVPGISQQADTK